MIELLPCPFCGGKPVVKRIGNDYVKKRTIQIKCSSCRVTRTDATLRQPGFEWLEKIAAESWNQRQPTSSDCIEHIPFADEIIEAVGLI